MTENIMTGNNIFSARKTGRGHIKKGIGCQDFSITEKTEMTTVMAVSDGVSKCERSEIGARLACESVAAVVRNAEKNCKDEEELVARLGSIIFREKIAKNWVNQVVRHIEENYEDYDVSRDFYKYGATLLYAIVTDKHIITANIGDGQVLLFNDTDAVKLRVHKPKESNRVRTLINEKCYIEDCSAAVFKRGTFDGILLSTDGMYDKLGSGVSFHEYAKKLKTEFTETGKVENPFLAYDSEEDRFIDIAEAATHDDCTVVLYVDDCMKDEIFAEKRKVIESVSNQAILSRYTDRVESFSIIKDEEFKNIVVSPIEEIDISEIPDINLIASEDTLISEGYVYRTYEDVPYSSIEAMFSNGELREKKETDSKASLITLDIYKCLRAIEGKLNSAGYMLGAAANFLTYWNPDMKRIELKIEAITKLEPGKSLIWTYFESLLGQLVVTKGKAIFEGTSIPEEKEAIEETIVAEEKATLEEAIVSKDIVIPVFKIGFVAEGKDVVRPDILEETPFFCLIKEGKKNELYMRNNSKALWKLEGGEVVKPGESTMVVDGMKVEIADEDVHFIFVKKEAL